MIPSLASLVLIRLNKCSRKVFKNLPSNFISISTYLDVCNLQEADAGYEEISSEDEFIELDEMDMVCIILFSLLEPP